MHTQKHNRDSLLNNYLDILLGWSAHFPLKDRSKNKNNNSNEKPQSFSKPKPDVIICYEKLETLTLEQKLMPSLSDAAIIQDEKGCYGLNCLQKTIGQSP